MSLELSNNYTLSNYSETNINKKTSAEKSDSTASEKSTAELSSSNENTSMDEYYKKLCDKFPNLKFQVGLGDIKPGKLVPTYLKGLGNIRIDPVYLKKAASDPKVAEDLEKKLEYVPSADAWLQGMYSMQGKKVVATVTGIDANGDFFSGSLTVPINSNSDSKSKNKPDKVSSIDLNEILQKKHKKLKEQKEAESRRLELMSQRNTNAASLQKKIAKNYSSNLFNGSNIKFIDSNR
jgi:hypothetical protein